jgi:hypothetical protein
MTTEKMAMVIAIEQAKVHLSAISPHSLLHPIMKNIE